MDAMNTQRFSLNTLSENVIDQLKSPCLKSVFIAAHRVLIFESVVAPVLPFK